MCIRDRFYKWTTGDTGLSVTLTPDRPGASAIFDTGKDAIVVLAYDAINGQLSEVSVSVDYSPIGRAPAGCVVAPGTHVVEVPELNEFGHKFSFWADYCTEPQREVDAPATLIAVYGDTRVGTEEVIDLSGARLPKLPGPPADYTAWVAVFGTLSAISTAGAVYFWRCR